MTLQDAFVDLSGRVGSTWLGQKKIKRKKLAMDMALEQQRDSFRRRDEEFTRRTTGQSQEATSIESIPELAVAMTEQFSHLVQAMQSQTEILRRLHGSNRRSNRTSAWVESNAFDISLEYDSN